MLSKQQLRVRLKQARLAMPEDEVTVKSQQIVAWLKELLNQIQPITVHCYEPIANLHEVDVAPLITYLHATRPQAAIYTSRYIDKSWRIVTLDGHTVTRSLHYDCIIVPMIGFDPRLHRLGYGGGHYDRLLSEQPHTLKIGVCFELGKVAELPNEPHDVPLDVIITEQQMYRR
jgi:5-formyltetrahydrofolate cyclo-ligase